MMTCINFVYCKHCRPTVAMW